MRPGGAEHVVLRGEDALLRPRAALTLTMAFHELITNAAKYGALSGPNGRIEMSWEIVDGATLHIAWAERGGPPVKEPERRGVGSKLIENSVGAELGGRVDLTFAPDGLRCTIDIPLQAAAAQDECEPAGVDWSI